MQELDPRIIKVGIEVNGKVKIYQDLDIAISGTKYANPLQNECEIKITNIDRVTTDYILTETSPYNKNKTPKSVFVEAGRKSFGVSRIYVGNITSSSISQPPDVALTLKCLTKNYDKGNLVTRNSLPRANLSAISQQVANDLNLALDFQAADRVISNYAFTGAALKQVNKISESGKVNAYVDDAVLVVKDLNVPLKNRIRVLNIDSGLIGTPEFTEEGVKVKYLIDTTTRLGGALRIQSKMNPAINGDYTIYKLSFEIASRDVPFYWIAEAKRI